MSVCRYLPILLIIGMAATVGCDHAPDDAYVGPWTVDPTQVVLPKIENQLVDTRIRMALSQATLKLRSDHSFTLSLTDVLEGKWRVEGNSVTLAPRDGSPSVEMAIERPGRAIRFRHDTMIGEASVLLHKSG